jgi:hypothetical protein
MLVYQRVILGGAVEVTRGYNHGKMGKIRVISLQLWL